MDFHTTNQPGFVNEEPYYDHGRPRRPHVELPCASLSKRAFAVWKEEGDASGWKARWARDVARFFAKRPHVRSIKLYDPDGNVLETLTPSEAAQPEGA